MNFKTAKVHFFLIIFLTGFLSFNVYSQKAKFYVLVYKYKEGDKYRITTSTYKNFSTTAGAFTSSFSGETSFDLFQEIEGADDEAADMKIRIELTRQTENGKNLTYKLSGMFKEVEVRLAFDRYGRVLPNSAQYQKIDSQRASQSEQLSLLSNIFVPLPNRAVKAGDAWDVSEVFGAEQLSALAGSSYGIKRPDVRGQYTLESVDDGIAKIVLHLEVSGNGKLTELKDSPEFDFLLQIDGIFHFEVAQGKIVNGSITTEAVGVASMGDTNIDFKGSLMSTFNVEKY
ncbi:TULIP family P47-like protein [bacterium]|nr:TULIP family P47-like protein [bacterium]